METIKPKKTLTEETYDILVEAICNGELKPGERLTQDEIASRLNVSRQPVNSAISILKTNRLVEDTGRRGVVVAPIDPALSASIYELRLAIEPFVLRLAADRRPDTAADEARAIMAEGHVALASGSVRAMVDADMHFHEMLYRWGGNDVVMTSMASNWHHIRRAMVIVLRQPGLPEKSWRDHEAILSALLSGDVPGAQSEMVRHIEEASDRIVGGLK